MIMSKTPGLQLFWNWVNQSQNAMVNYCNRNATSQTSTTTLALSYVGAVSSALGVVYGLNQLARRMFPGRARLLTFIAFPASVVASSTNCYIVRRPELSTGIPLTDEDGRELLGGQKSFVAAGKAVGQTVFSRAILQIPVFLIPALMMSLP